MAYAQPSSHSHPVAQINITPLVDVMLTMLIIFMLAAPLLSQRVEIGIAPGKSDDKPTIVQVMVQGDGAVLWDGKLLPDAALDAQFAYSARQTPQPVINVDAQDTVQYALVAGVLAKAKMAGIESLAFRDR
jgi:biopolymer transport protein ExbD